MDGGRSGHRLEFMARSEVGESWIAAARADLLAAIEEDELHPVHAAWTLLYDCFADEALRARMDEKEDAIWQA